MPLRDTPGSPPDTPRYFSRSSLGSRVMPTLRGATIRLLDLVPHGESVITALDAEDCTLLGPAVVMPLGQCVMDDCTWEAGGGGVEAVVWDIDPHRQRVVGAIGLQDCTLRRCRLQLVGFAGPADAVRQFLGLARV